MKIVWIEKDVDSFYGIKFSELFYGIGDNECVIIYQNLKTTTCTRHFIVLFFATTTEKL